MPDIHTVECSRVYRASIERVFRAFTDPAMIRRWWSPDPAVSVDVLAWSLVPGGPWRFAYSFPDDRVIHVTGVFRVVEPNTRLVFTWTWEPPDVHAGIETLVSITLESQDDGTIVHVRHDGFPDQRVRDRHDIGWTATLRHLMEVLP